MIRGSMSIAHNPIPDHDDSPPPRRDRSARPLLPDLRPALEAPTPPRFAKAQLPPGRERLRVVGVHVETRDSDPERPHAAGRLGSQRRGEPEAAMTRRDP